MATGRAVSTKSSIVPRAVFHLTFGVDMEKRAFFIVAGVESRIKITFGHFGHIVFVKKFAVVPFFAKAAKPMFANYSAIAADMTERTRRPFGAGRFGVKFADGNDRFVHSRERKRQSSMLFFEGDFNVEFNAFYVSHNKFHRELKNFQIKIVQKPTKENPRI